MDNFRIVYKLLKRLEFAMDCEEIDEDLLTPESLATSKTRLDAIWAMLVENDYVSGVLVRRYKNQPAPVVYLNGPRITLKGLEYLQENSLMQKAANLAKGIVSIVS